MVCAPKGIRGAKKRVEGCTSKKSVTVRTFSLFFHIVSRVPLDTSPLRSITTSPLPLLHTVTLLRCTHRRCISPFHSFFLQCRCTACKNVSGAHHFLVHPIRFFHTTCWIPLVCGLSSITFVCASAGVFSTHLMNWKMRGCVSEVKLTECHGVSDMQKKEWNDEAVCTFHYGSETYRVYASKKNEMVRRCGEVG